MNQLSLNSIQAYHKETKTGRLSGRRKMVYGILKMCNATTKGVLTAARLQNPHIEKNSISGRITELVSIGMVCSVDSIKDINTGNTVNVWGVIKGATPHKPIKKPNKDRIINELRIENQKLRKDIE